MKVVNLTQESAVYTSNVYLVTGSWNRMSDVNTLVDVGMDERVIERINAASTGFGKHKVEQIVLTHSHFDHTGMLGRVKQEFHSTAYAFSNLLEGVDHLLADGDNIKMGDCVFEVIHITGHSSDSICLYGRKEKVLFAGDTPLVIRSRGDEYPREFTEALERLSQDPIETIYFGHGGPLKGDCNFLIRQTIRNIEII